MGNRKSPNQLNTVNNAISLLRMFLSSESISLTDVEKELNISKTTAFRLVTTMAERGLLYKNDKTKRYSPGILLFQLIRKYQKYDIVAISDRYIEELATKTDESVYLTIRSGYNYLFLTGRESTQMLKVTTPLGDEYSLYVGAAGKLHLAFLSDNEINQYFEKVEYKKYTSATLTKKQLRDELKQIRKQRYSLSKGERISDAIGIAVPIFDSNEFIVATIGIYFPETRYSKKIEQKYIKELQQYARKIQQRMLDN
ncbi:IclR family transcriptional regulator [Pueribacillus sp. YX66]|uniref:IclR family transcriptional regulator n=1 Tax=Pueribacillus sp. YX66 TaxID=3229242 RepID=UPI00358D009A